MLAHGQVRMRGPEILSKAAWSSIGHILDRGSIVAASMVLSNFLNPVDFAIYSYFLLTASMLASYAALGMGVTASRLFAESCNLPPEEWPPLGALWLLSSCIGIVIALVILVLPDTLISSYLDLPAWLLAAGVFALTLNVVPSGGVLGLELYQPAASVAIMSACVLLFGVYLAGTDQLLGTAIWIFVLSRVTQLVGNAVLIIKSVGIKHLLRTARAGIYELKGIAVFAGPMLIVSLLAAAGPWLVGRIILDGPSGSSGFAAYAIGMQWTSLVLFIPGMISRVLFPRLVSLRMKAGKAMTNEKWELVLLGSYLALVSALLFAFVGILASPYLVRLYGADLSVSHFLLASFMLASVPAAVANTLGNAIVADDGQQIWLAVTLLWFVALVLGAHAFSVFGPIAGAYAYGCAAFILSGLAFSVLKKRGTS